MFLKLQRWHLVDSAKAKQWFVKDDYPVEWRHAARLSRRKTVKPNFLLSWRIQAPKLRTGSTVHLSVRWSRSERNWHLLLDAVGGPLPACFLYVQVSGGRYWALNILFGQIGSKLSGGRHSPLPTSDPSWFGLPCLFLDCLVFPIQVMAS